MLLSVERTHILQDHYSCFGVWPTAQPFASSFCLKSGKSTLAVNLWCSSSFATLDYRRSGTTSVIAKRSLQSHLFGSGTHRVSKK